VTRIIRRHSAERCDSEAVYSACETYRYALTRCWDSEARRLLYIMLNPSKATEEVNDPTIERCERRARRLGYGAFRVVNLFSLRETDPRCLLKAGKPLGPEDDAQLAEALVWTDDVLCAWGVHGTHKGRDMAVRALLEQCERPVYVLGLTLHGHPRHPLYMPYAAEMQRWEVGAESPD
jgi:hypothetical protein